MSEYFRKPIVKTLMLKGQEGQSIKEIKKTSTNGFVDTYTITLTDGTTSTFTVTNGKEISSIDKTETNGFVDTYTITFNDGTTSTFTVTNGREVSSIQKTETSGLVDTYTIKFNDGTESTFTITNGKAISSIDKAETNGLVDTYTITFNDGTESTFTVTNGAKGDKGLTGPRGPRGPRGPKGENGENNKPAVDALEKRLDNLILSSGNESSAEVIDARTGYDGKAYNTLGTAIRTQVNDIYDALQEKIMYLESNITVTDGERGHRTNVVLDMSQPIYVSITPKTTNTFNVFITHGETEVQFLTEININGGTTHTFVFNREIIDNVAKDYGINAFDENWRVNIRNATNSNNYRYSIFIKENEKVEHNKKVYVSSTNDVGTFSLVSYACNYLKAKYNNVPCTVFVKNGIYEENPITEFPYAPINIADTMINVIGESVDGVIINLINSSQKQNRIMHIGGFQTIANMTLNVLADDTYQGNNGNNPYVIHNDDTYDNFTEHYSTTVENCKLYSECSSPIGGGLHGNQTQIYRNVVFIYNSMYDTGGCLYVHGASNEGQIPDGLIIDGCTAISKNGTLALTLPSVTGYTPYTETPVTIRRTILATNGDTEVASDFKSTHKLTSDSKLNSNEYINY